MLNKFTAILLFKTAEFLKNEHISKKIVELKLNEYKSIEQINQLSFFKLKKLLEYAKNYSPYYTDKFKNINLAKINTFSDLSKLPIIDKNDLRDNIKAISSVKFKKRTHIAKTSGSTGIPLIFPKDSDTAAYQYAAMFRGHSWYGTSIGDREARLWGVPVDRRAKIITKGKDFLLNRFREKNYRLTDDVLEDFYIRLNKYRPKYIMGYGKMLAEFGKYLIQNSKGLSHLTLKMAKYTSEGMTQEEQSIVKETFGCPVVSEYGCAEAGILTFQCPQGSHHIMSDCIFLEYLDTDLHQPDFKEVVVTDLNNLSFPIIRYKVGDLVSPTDKKCKCSLPFPIVDKIFGRSSEVFITNTGKKFHSIIFHYIMRGFTEISKDVPQFRVIQKNDKTFCYQIKSLLQKKAVEDYLIHKTKQEIGSDIQVEIEYYDCLPRVENGKLRDFIPYTKLK